MRFSVSQSRAVQSLGVVQFSEFGLKSHFPELELGRTLRSQESRFPKSIKSHFPRSPESFFSGFRSHYSQMATGISCVVSRVSRSPRSPVSPSTCEVTIPEVPRSAGHRVRGRRANLGRFRGAACGCPETVTVGRCRNGCDVTRKRYVTLRPDVLHVVS